MQKRVDIMKQRKIGKQQLLVNIIQRENIYPIRKSFLMPSIPSISPEDVMKWSSMTPEEIELLLRACDDLTSSKLSSDTICQSTKMEDYEREKNKLHFMVYTYRKYGDRLLHDVELESLDSFYENEAEKNYDGFCTLWEEEYRGDDFQSKRDAFQSAIEKYVRHFIETVEGFLEEGIEWEVITEMLERKMTEQRFSALKTVFSK